MSSEAGEGTSSSSSPNKEQMDTKLKALNMLAQGKRNLICGEIPTAVQQFQDACQMLSDTFGEMASECAEAYFLYGSTLLDLSRMEQDVLGNALEGVDMDADDEGGPCNQEQFESPTQVDEEERIKLRMQVVDAMSEDEISNQALLYLGKNTTGGATSFGDVIIVSPAKEGQKRSDQVDEEMETEENTEEQKGQSNSQGLDEKVAEIVIDEGGQQVDVDGQGTETKDEAMEDDGEDKAEEEKTENTEEGEEGGEDEESEEGEEAEEGEGETEEGKEDGEKNEGEEDPDDVSNLQLSWEMLELSKIIYSRTSTKESQLKAAEACLKLGEVGLESEQYEQAISDLQACLDIQKQHLDPYDRAVAETHYQMGLACQMCKELDKARDHFTSAMACLKEKIEKLRIVVKEDPPQEPSKFLKPAERAEKEIQEILKILPEIEEKITDTNDEARTMENLKTMAKEAMGSIFSAVSESTTEGFDSSSTSPVKSAEVQKASDISHLIRKKRKPEEEKKDEEAVEIKKKREEDGSGDAGDVKGLTEDGRSGVTAV